MAQSQRRDRSDAVSDPFLALTLRDQIGSTNLLANPRIRVKNMEHAKIRIGDRVRDYDDDDGDGICGGIGELPRRRLGEALRRATVYLDDEVGIKIGLEVSSIVREVQSASGTLTYQVGTRTASTVLRLHDGETQVLAGLISDEDRRSVNQIPGLGDVPILGKLFGSHSDTSDQNRNRAAHHAAHRAQPRTPGASLRGIPGRNGRRHRSATAHA